MSDLGWFGVFALIFLLMALVSGWMVWFSRRAMKSHTGQIENMVQEMREVIKEDRQEPPDEGEADSG